MVDERIIQILESIGLSKNEALVYLDLLRAGKSSAGDVSKRTKIHRSNTYDILEKMIMKGLVKQIIERDKKFFYPVEPSSLLNYFKQRENSLVEIMPEIKKMQSKPKEERQVSVSEGIGSVKSVLLNLLELKEPMAVYGTPKETIEILGGFVNEFHEKRIKNKILMRHIVGAGSVKRIRAMNKMEHTEARYLPSSYSAHTSTNICGDRVVIILWDMPVSVISIKNRNVAETYRNYFEILWREAKVQE